MHKFAAHNQKFLEKLRDRTEKAAKDEKSGPVGIGIAEIAALFLQLLPQVLPIFAACKKQPPTPPPIPAPLVAAGVTQETWEQAHGAKFAATQSKAKKGHAHSGGFIPAIVNNTAAEIAKAKGIKHTKDAKPMAIASLQAGFEEPVEDMATAMQEAKDNAAVINP